MPADRGRAGWRTGLARVWLAGVVAGAVFAPMLPLADPAAMDLTAMAAPPRVAGVLGNDALGRDLLSRLVYGARVSLTVGLLSPLIALAGGGLIGLLAAYRRGAAERMARFAVDVALAFPALVLALALVGYLGRSLSGVVLVLGLLGIPAFARVVRVNAVGQLASDHCLAARAVGVGAAGLLWRHVLPNMAAPLAAFTLLASATMISAEGALGFLGLSVPPPTPSWGGMIAEGREVIETAPRVFLAPAAAIFLTVLALNTLADPSARVAGASPRD